MLSHPMLTPPPPASPVEQPRRVAVLGATGSIGRNALEVISASEGRLEAFALSAHARCEELLELAQQHRPRFVVASDTAAAAATDWSSLPEECELILGSEGLADVVAEDDVDLVLAAIVGSAGLQSTWSALAAGKTIALANKETLVMGGQVVLDHAQAHNATLLPVDSEHSAAWQAMAAGRRDEVAKVILTASGGPFWQHTTEQLANVTVEEALQHPTWQMGDKISIDSATLMNKALEVIEARYLFDLPVEQIDVLVHPQSLVHSLVEFIDHSVIAQLGPPDMRLPIQYALEYPHRQPAAGSRLPWEKLRELTFAPVDHERFPAIKLGFEVAAAGGTAGCVLNAANEAAVAAFLDGKLPFLQIVPACRSVLESHNFSPTPTLSELLALDAWARQEVHQWICS